MPPGPALNSRPTPLPRVQRHQLRSPIRSLAGHLRDLSDFVSQGIHPPSRARTFMRFHSETIWLASDIRTFSDISAMSRLSGARVVMGGVTPDKRTGRTQLLRSVRMSGVSALDLDGDPGSRGKLVERGTTRRRWRRRCGRSWPAVCSRSIPGLRDFRWRTAPADLSGCGGKLCGSRLRVSWGRPRR
jgi:hypothetical protein